MTTLREAAQQALEALEAMQAYAAAERKGLRICDEAITALRAALAQQDEPCPNCASLEAQNTELDRKLAELERAHALAQEQAEPVLQTCNCRWDGNVQVQQCTLHEAHVDAIHEWAERAKTAEKKLAARAQEQAEPVQEPVAVVGTQVDVWRGCDGRWAPPGGPIKTALMLKDMPVGTMLYTAPPQRQPLTEEKIDAEWHELDGEASALFKRVIRKFARAVERAHGIGEQP